MILPRPDAPVGSVTRLSSYSPEDFRLPDAAGLCRNTAPLVSFAFDLLARSVPCHIVGKDIRVGLEKLIDKIKGDSISGFKMNLVRHSAAETEKLRRKGKREQAANYEDKCNALLAIASRCPTPSGANGIKAKVEIIFRDGTGLTLSTIHKAKGLEWETVFLLDWSLLPSPYAETDAQRQQEKNLQYVAVTRAKLNLKFINTGNWKV